MMSLSEQMKNRITHDEPVSDEEIEDYADEAAKLTQAVNDKDLDLFESQELAAALLEALAEALYTVHVMEANLTVAWNKQSDSTKQIWRDKAIRKANQ